MACGSPSGTPRETLLHNFSTLDGQMQQAEHAVPLHSSSDYQAAQCEGAVPLPSAQRPAHRDAAAAALVSADLAGFGAPAVVARMSVARRRPLLPSSTTHAGSEPLLSHMDLLHDIQLRNSCDPNSTPTHLQLMSGPSPGMGLGLGVGFTDMSLLASPGSIGLAAMLMATRTPRVGGEDDPLNLSWQDGQGQSPGPLSHLQGGSPSHMHHHHQALLSVRER